MANIRVVDPPGYFLHGPYREVTFATRMEQESKDLALALVLYLDRRGIRCGCTHGYTGVYFDLIGVDLVEQWCQSHGLNSARETTT